MDTYCNHNKNYKILSQLLTYIRISDILDIYQHKISLLLGLVKVTRMALHQHYPKMSQDGFEALFSRYLPRTSPRALSAELRDGSLAH